MSKPAKTQNKAWTKQQVLDVTKDILGWVFVTAASFVYWLAVLLIFSLVLLSIWHVTFESLLRYSFLLMGATSLVYLVRLLYKRFYKTGQ